MKITARIETDKVIIESDSLSAEEKAEIAKRLQARRAEIEQEWFEKVFIEPHAIIHRPVEE